MSAPTKKVITLEDLAAQRKSADFVRNLSKYVNIGQSNFVELTKFWRRCDLEHAKRAYPQVTAWVDTVLETYNTDNDVRFPDYTEKLKSAIHKVFNELEGYPESDLALLLEQGYEVGTVAGDMVFGDPRTQHVMMLTTRSELDDTTLQLIHEYFLKCDRIYHLVIVQPNANLVQQVEGYSRKNKLSEIRRLSIDSRRMHEFTAQMLQIFSNLVALNVKIFTTNSNEQEEKSLEVLARALDVTLVDELTVETNNMLLVHLMQKIPSPITELIIERDMNVNTSSIYLHTIEQMLADKSFTKLKSLTIRCVSPNLVVALGNAQLFHQLQEFRIEDMSCGGAYDSPLMSLILMHAEILTHLVNITIRSDHLRFVHAIHKRCDKLKKLSLLVDIDSHNALLDAQFLNSLHSLNSSKRTEIELKIRDMTMFEKFAAHYAQQYPAGNIILELAADYISMDI